MSSSSDDESVSGSSSSSEDETTTVRVPPDEYLRPMPAADERLTGLAAKRLFNDVLMLADQMLRRLKTVHDQYFLHKDIKPANFVLGLGKHSNKVYLLDFGLSKRYIQPNSKKHIK